MMKQQRGCRCKPILLCQRQARDATEHMTLSNYCIAMQLYICDVALADVVAY